ncbi:MAG: hypothetical protein PVJ80_04730 [Gemmatimonadota bacterium]|jgi:hypothetical protein
MGFFLEAVIGAIVWTFANVLYVDLRRKGARKGRVLSFLVGYPGTLVSLFVVREGQVPEIHPPEDDEEALLREIRADREDGSEGPDRIEDPGQARGEGGPEAGPGT